MPSVPSRDEAERGEPARGEVERGEVVRGEVTRGEVDRGELVPSRGELARTRSDELFIVQIEPRSDALSLGTEREVLVSMPMLRVLPLPGDLVACGLKVTLPTDAGRVASSKSTVGDLPDGARGEQLIGAVGERGER